LDGENTFVPLRMNKLRKALRIFREILSRVKAPNKTRAARPMGPKWAETWVMYPLMHDMVMEVGGVRFDAGIAR
jgi:hypothetical protein